jgi:hypothetical protein
MANNLIGAPVANATSYKLFKKNGSNYTEVASANVQLTNLEFTNDGYYDFDGKWHIDQGYGARSTDFIPLTALANDSDGYCLRYLEPMENTYPKVVFFSKNFTFMGAADIYALQAGNASATTFTVDQIKATMTGANATGAAYAVFISGWDDDYSGANDSVTIKGIYFNLDEVSGLASGTTHSLVVQAIGEGGTDVNGDGIIYTDSGYSNAVTWTKA